MTSSNVSIFFHKWIVICLSFMYVMDVYKMSLLILMDDLKTSFCRLLVSVLWIKETILKRLSRKIYSFKETNKASEIYYYQSIWKLMTHWIVHEPKPDFIIIVSRGWWRTTPFLRINYKYRTYPHCVFVFMTIMLTGFCLANPPTHFTHYIIIPFLRFFLNMIFYTMKK